MWAAIISGAGSLALGAGTIIYVVKKLTDAHKRSDEANLKLLAEKTRIFELESQVLRFEMAEKTINAVLMSKTRELELETKARKDLEKNYATLVEKLAATGDPGAVSDAINFELSELSNLPGSSKTGDPVR